MKKSTKIAALSIGAAAATAAAVARFAGSTNDVPAEPEPVPDPVLEPGIDAEAFLDHLAAAIRIDTSVYEDRSRNDPAAIREMHEFLVTAYPSIHEQCEREIVNDLSLLYTWRGTDPDAKPLVLMAHMDVVPVEAGTVSDWTVAPFSGETVDGHLWGRGSLDDKGPLIATMEAVEHLLRAGFEPTRTVYLVFGHDEEIGGTQGAATVADLLRSRGVRPWIVVDEGGAVLDEIPLMSDRPVALVKVAEKGYVDLKLTATGQGGHSSIPPASTAAGTLAKALVALEANPMPSRIHVLDGLFRAVAPRMDPALRAVTANLRLTGPAVSRLLSREPRTDALIRTTTAVTMISGGVKPNVLPQESWAVVNFRILPGDGVADVIDHVRSVVGPDIAIEPYGEMQAEPSRFSSTEGAAWEVLSTTVRETFPDAVVAPWVLTGATDSRYFSDLADEVYGFAPFTSDPDLAGVHGTDERMRIADAERAVSFVARFIRSAAS